MKPLYRKWLSQIKDGMTHAHATQLGHRLTAADMASSRSSLTPAEWAGLAHEATRVRPLMAAADQARGLAWLRSLALTPTGRERKHNPLTPEQLALLDAPGVAIRLAGYTSYSNGYRTVYQPVYRVVAPYGHGGVLERDFCYAVAWNRSDALAGNAGSGSPVDLWPPIIPRRAWAEDAGPVTLD